MFYRTHQISSLFPVFTPRKLQFDESLTPTLDSLELDFDALEEGVEDLRLPPLEELALTGFFRS